jgi:hypothetical protein
LQWLRTLQNPLLWWMINDRLQELNEYEVDPALLDRTLEFGEALGDIARHPGIVTTPRIDDNQFMLEGFKEFLEENGEGIEGYV